MTLNASIAPNPQGGHTVTAYKEFLCPACKRFLCEMKQGVIRIRCSRCKALWKLEDGVSTMIKPPKKVGGNIINVIEASLKK